MRSLLYIGILLCGFSCARNAPCLHPGDLLFQVGETSEMTGAITAATGKERQLNYSHVGIAVRSRGVDSVLEGTSDGGVRVTALGDFLARSARIDGRPAVTVMRLRDTTGVAAAIERAQNSSDSPTITRSDRTTARCIAANWYGKATSPRTAADDFRPGR